VNSPAQRAPDAVYRTILVPLDGSRFADGAIPTARALAGRFGATIHTVTVATSDLELQRIRVQAASALGTDPDEPRIHDEVDTDVAGAVHDCATDLDSCLVCVSTHGRGRVPGTLIGSTARDLIERGRQPVVVAGPFVVHPDPEDETAIPPLGVDHLVA
jgi:nucleotide-binding universal stress UspA family protein